MGLERGRETEAERPSAERPDRLGECLRLGKEALPQGVAKTLPADYLRTEKLCDFPSRTPTPKPLGDHPLGKFQQTSWDAAKKVTESRLLVQQGGWNPNSSRGPRAPSVPERWGPVPVPTQPLGMTARVCMPKTSKGRGRVGSGTHSQAPLKMNSHSPAKPSWVQIPPPWSSKTEGRSKRVPNGKHPSQKRTFG